MTRRKKPEDFRSFRWFGVKDLRAFGHRSRLYQMGYDHAAVGTQVEIGKLDGQQKRLPAVVVPMSHYDPQKKRPRS